MGSKHVGVTRHGNGIRIAFTVNGEHVRETLPLPPTPANMKAAARIRAAVLNDIAHGRFDYAKHFPHSPRARTGGTETVADALRAWLTLQQRDLAYSTWVDYRNIVNNTLIPEFGALRLADVTPERVREWRMSSGAGSKRLNNVLIPLRAIFDGAYYAGTIERNPLDRVKPLPVHSKVADPFEPREVAAILAAAPPGGARNLLAFLFASGLRTGEVIALTWADYDSVRKSLRVDKSVVRERERTGGKTRQSVREVDVTPAIEAALRGQRSLSQLAGGRIFLNPVTTRPWKSPGEINTTVWAPALARTRVRPRNLYQTRHTFASIALMAGENPMWVARQMGHADWGMIRKVYGKYLKQMDGNAGHLLSQALNQ